MLGHLRTSESALVWAEYERNSLAEDVPRLAQEKAKAVHFAFDLQDDFDIRG